MTIGKPFQPHEKRKFGDLRRGHYTEFEDDGTLAMHGDATVYRDEFGSLLASKLESPASHIVQDSTEGVLEFKTTCVYGTDWVLANFQFNHDREDGSVVSPHLHWFQSNAAIPNWLIQYRWQVNGQAKTVAWTNKKYTTHAFSYSAGTLTQITAFGTISPPAGAGISSILQVKLIRDTTNASALFSGADPLAASAFALFCDVHKRVDMVGSRSEYTK